MDSNVTRFRHWIKGLADVIWPPQKIEMTIQTDRFLIIRQKRLRRIWCRQCGREVDAVRLPELEGLAGGAQPLLPGNARSEAWHISVAEDGEQLVCLHSFLNSRPPNGEV